MKKKRVVVVGGGFAGSTVARKLEKYFEVILIDTKNYFEFTPGILRTLVEPSHIKKIQVLHSHYLKHSEIITGKVSEISKNMVLIGKRKINFDYLIISSGSKYELPIKEQEVIIATRAEHLRSYSRRLEKSENILIIGGGLVGIELASEITTHYPIKKITLIQGDKELIPRNNRKTGEYAFKFLRKRNINIIFNKFIHNLDYEKKEYDLIFLCTGIKPNFEFMKKNFSKNLNENNQIKVNDFLQVEGFKNIFAAGDISDIKDEKTAQNAEKQACLAAKNICALEKGKELEKYKTKKRIIVISLGKYNGILEFGNFVFSGIIPGLLKTIIERREMMKLRKAI
ncbi:MAG: FAD-dependent oxidoreductase [Candidatus Pacearchaeota archaeon]|nr:FAD-dependent oxidoreductase [Candidatus Pacearchaeota archaeon]